MQVQLFTDYTRGEPIIAANPMQEDRSFRSNSPEWFRILKGLLLPA
jgi:hypothetical protein